MHNPYYSFNSFLRDKFGERAHKLSLDAGFSCPNIDGSKSGKGCIFCNNRSFSRFVSNRRIPLKEQIRQSMEYAFKRFKAKKFIAYFQSFTNTYAGVRELEEKYSVIKSFPEIVGLSVSTRPDCVDKEKIKLIKTFTSDYMVWIEYGLQTIHDKSLNFLNRGHNYEDFLKALSLTEGQGVYIGVHLILGILGETKEMMMETARKISKLPLSGVKFHCLYVVKDTLLEDMYDQGGVELLSEEEYADIVCGFLERIPPNWAVLRLVSDADREYLRAPLWVNQKQRVVNRIKQELMKRSSYQGRLFRSN